MAKKNGLFMNYVSTQLVHQVTANERTFSNVSIPMETSANGYGSFAVNQGQIFKSTKRDGSEITGLCSILLGAPEKTRKVSIAVKKSPRSKKLTYQTVELTNAQILEAWTASRKAYRASLATATEEA